MIDRMLSATGPEAITPEMPCEIIAEIAHSPSLSRYREEFIEGRAAQQQLSLLRQARIKQASDQIAHRHVEGLGQKIATIDPVIYEDMERRYGRGCWRDKEFLRDTLKRNPALQVRCETRTTLVVNGFRQHKGNVGHGANGARLMTTQRPQGEPATPLFVGHETAGVSLVLP